MDRVVLIPVKRFDRAKTRLSSALSPDERRVLSERFLIRTLDLAKRVAGVDQVVIVTSDPRAIAIAEDQHVAVVEERVADLNQALRLGRDGLLAARPRLDLMVLPTDLPLATPEALDSMFARSADVGIAPDEKRSGTNVLRLRGRAASEFQFRFGPNSFDIHCRQAVERGLSLDVFADPGLAFDIDTAEQYAFWMRRRGCAS